MEYVGFGLIICISRCRFVFLLSRDLKKNGRLLSTVAIGVIVMRFVDLIWRPVRSFTWNIRLSWMINAVVGIGGVWLWFFATQLNAVRCFRYTTGHRERVCNESRALDQA